jgi:hypothetical protein
MLRTLAQYFEQADEIETFLRELTLSMPIDELCSSDVNSMANVHDVDVWRHSVVDVLYDTSVLLTYVGHFARMNYNTLFSDDDPSAVKHNVRRENKLYKYKDQMADLQLQREMAEKRRREGKEIKLTPKQMDAQRTQLAKERHIRERVGEVIGALI